MQICLLTYDTPPKEDKCYKACELHLESLDCDFGGLCIIQMLSHICGQFRQFCALRTLNFLLHKNFQKSCQIALTKYRIKSMSSCFRGKKSWSQFDTKYISE